MNSDINATGGDISAVSDTASNDNETVSGERASTTHTNGGSSTRPSRAKSGNARISAARANAKGESLPSDMSYPVEVSIRSLLEVGAHFGHQTQKWNPKMLPHIYCAKNGIHILNLDGTLKLWDNARKFIVDTVSRGGTLLFVGTKLQARDIVQEEAARSGSFYVTTRWLGGTLSNFQTIKNSIERMRKLEELLAQSEVEGSKVKLTKKEKLEITREVGKLEQSLGGIRNMKRPPDIIFVIDVLKETIAVQEARRLRIPVVALTDTNADPDRIEYPIPCNDDATRAIRLFAAAVGDAVIEGRAVFNARPARERQELLQQLEGRAQQAAQGYTNERSERSGRGGRGGRGGPRGYSDATGSGAPSAGAKPEAEHSEASLSGDTNGSGDSSGVTAAASSN
jgi:small subunit ribosomal protein S2